MVRKLIGMISILALAGVLSGLAYANPIPTQITFGPSTAGSVTSSTSAVKFSGISGLAWQSSNGPGSFTLANANIAVTGGSNGVYTLASNAEAFTVTIGGGTLSGTLSLDTVTSPASTVPTFIGKFTVTGSSGAFPSTGFHVGNVVDTDFLGYKGTVSAGEIVPDPVPEPGTIALLGSGLLGMAGILRRRF